MSADRQGGFDLPRFSVYQNGEWCGSTSNLDDALGRAALLVGGEVFDRLTRQFYSPDPESFDVA